MAAPEVAPTDVERFLYYEAHLLDSHRYEEWLALFTPDAIYWVPNIRADGNPDEDGVIAHDDYLGLKGRVRRLRHPANMTQVPLPRTRHFITNVLPTALADDEMLVTSNQIVYVIQGRRQAQFPGGCEHRLRRQDGAWRIRSKKVALLACNQPLIQVPVL